MTVSIAPNDHNGALHNGGLAEDLGGLPRGQPNQAIPSQSVCAAVAPVEITSELSYVRTEKARNTPAAAV